MTVIALCLVASVMSYYIGRLARLLADRPELLGLPSPGCGVELERRLLEQLAVALVMVAVGALVVVMGEPNLIWTVVVVVGPLIGLRTLVPGWPLPAGTPRKLAVGLVVAAIVYAGLYYLYALARPWDLMLGHLREGALSVADVGMLVASLVGAGTLTLRLALGGLRLIAAWAHHWAWIWVIYRVLVRLVAFCVVLVLIALFLLLSFGAMLGSRLGF